MFDWGEDADGPYLVLEYLGGGSLRDLLDRGVRLSHSQAAQLGAEVAQGLAYAHVRGLVHRDIKPANLLFDEEGRVRVADFGVARALAEAAWTEPAGAMVGTARYISPEAAEGKPVDGRADVYSLALVLYEAVTGTVPFVTDTTMGTLAARIGQPLPHDEALGPLDDVLARAAAPEVATRLDAAGLAARLGALAAALPTPAPLPLVVPHLEDSSPISGFRAPGVSELTDSGIAAVGSSTVVAPAASGTPIGTKAGPGEIFDAEPSGERPGAAGPKGGDGAGPGRRRSAAGATGARGLDRRRRGGGRAPGGGAGPRVRDGRPHALAPHADPGEPVPGPGPGCGGQGQHEPEGGRPGEVDHRGRRRRGVPDPEARGVAEGRLERDRRGLRGQARRVGPVAGEHDLLRRPRTALQAVHLQPYCTPGAYSNAVPSTIIVSWSSGKTQNPTQAPYGSTITIVPSLGHEPATVPSLPATYTFAQAQAALQAVGLTATQNTQPSATVPQGNVISSSPASGAQAPYGSAVTVNVSSGPPTTTVPNVLLDTVRAGHGHPPGTGPGRVGSQRATRARTSSGREPSIGSTVPTGSSVELYTQGH